MFALDGWAGLLRAIEQCEESLKKLADLIDSERLKSIKDSQDRESLRKEKAAREKKVAQDREYSRKEKAAREKTAAAREEKVEGFLQLLSENGCLYKDSKNRNRERVPDTCKWFTNHRLFKQWNLTIEGQGVGLLFVTADLGCGKSVLSRYLIDDVLS
jgi:hypothetical protein